MKTIDISTILEDGWVLLNSGDSRVTIDGYFSADQLRFIAACIDLQLDIDPT